MSDFSDYPIKHSPYPGVLTIGWGSAQEDEK